MMVGMVSETALRLFALRRTVRSCPIPHYEGIYQPGASRSFSYLNFE